MQTTLREIFASIGVQLSPDALLIVVAIVSFLVAVAIMRLRTKTKLKQAQQQYTAEREQERAAHDDQLDQLSHTFSSLSQQALRDNSESFLNLAKQKFEQLQTAASGDLRAREQSFSNLIKPIEQAIKETDAQLRKFDTNRQVGDAKLNEQINNLLNSQHSLQLETSNLSKALRRPEIRGQWGELTLRRLVELAGMSEHCDFVEQASIATENGAIRPDMLINMPSNRQLIVDVKTPLDAFMNAAESDSEEQRKKFLSLHAQNLKKRIQELASKQYWQQFELSPDFVILFIPGDQFLSSALQYDRSLLEYALEKRILLATPTSLVGLLRAIAYGWNHETLSQNSEQLRDIGQLLYRRLNILTQHLNKLGSNLDQSVAQFNRLAGSFQQNIVPATKNLVDIGIADTQKEIISVAKTRGNLSRRTAEQDIPNNQLGETDND